MVFRFIGATADLGDGTMLERFGQAVTLDPKRAGELVLQNVALISDAEFETLGFTPAELEEYATTELHGNAAPEFLAKRNQAWTLLHEYREALLNPAPAPAASIPTTTTAPAAKGE